MRATASALTPAPQSANLMPKGSLIPIPNPRKAAGMKDRIASLVLLGSFVVLAPGCVTKSQFDEVKTQLDTCEKDKTASLATAAECQKRVESDAKRFDIIENSLTTVIPDTLKTFQEERTKIIQLVPSQVKAQVGAHFDRYATRVTAEFQKTNSKVDELQTALTQAQAKIAELTTLTQSVDTKVTATHEAVTTGQAKVTASVVDMRRAVSEITAQVVEFDTNRVNCEKCRDQIKFKGKGKEQILAFHSDLTKRLVALEGDVK